MVEVFKTTVTQKKMAARIVRRLQQEFRHYHANFDLGDVDRILRIVYPGPAVDVPGVLRVLEEMGFTGEVLPDTPAEPAPARNRQLRQTNFELAGQ